MRILQVLRAPVGGLFRHVLDLCEGLADRGHMVGVVVDSSTGDAMTEDKLAALAPHARLGIERVALPRLLGLGDVTSLRRIGAFARDNGIEIVHGHGAKGGLAARLAPAGPAARFYTPHGGALHYDPRRPVGALFMAIERHLLARTDAILFESAYAQATYHARVAAPSSREAVIHNGLRAREFEPVALRADAADFVFVGELRALKGIDLLVDALAFLQRADGTPATLAMAGDGPDAGMLRERIAMRGLSDRVTLAGVRPARDMFAHGRCVVVPSRAESLPYIVLEAAAAGRPIIATRVGGIAEIFGPTAPALIEPDNVPALAAAMQNTLDAPGALEADAGLRFAHVAAGFTVDAMAGAIEAEYRTALARGQRR